MKAMENAQAMDLIFDADGVSTPGADNLYRNIFGLRIEQSRDVFLRATILERFRQKYQRQFRMLIPSYSSLRASVIGNNAQKPPLS